MTTKPDMMSDGELDALLAHASVPPVPLGARQRLLDRIAAEVAQSAVPAIRPGPQRARLHWLAGLPLAASLALGFYLGNGGGLDAYLPAAAYDMLAGSGAEGALSGIEDVEIFNEDDLT